MHCRYIYIYMYIYILHMGFHDKTRLKSENGVGYTTGKSRCLPFI